jgi:hypothetical protein
MHWLKLAVAAVFAVAGVTVGLTLTPIAQAQQCDPSATVCEGNDQSDGPPEAAAPVTAPDEDYPLDDDWYFNPSGGGTALQPAHPSGGGGGHH